MSPSRNHNEEKKRMESEVEIYYKGPAPRTFAGGALGGGLGAVLGYLIGGPLGAVIGGALGAAIGGGLGAMADEQERKREEKKRKSEYWAVK